MELWKYINIILRRKLIIAATAIGTIALVGIATRYMTPVYQTSAILRIAVAAGGTLTSADYMYTDRLMNTYIEIATSRPVKEELVKRLGLTEPPTLQAEIIPSTELIKLTVEDENPRRAALVANTLAEILIAQEYQLYTGGGKTSTEVIGEQLTRSKADVDESLQEYQKLLVETPAAPEKIDAARQLFQLNQDRYASLLSQYEQARLREEIRANMITIFQAAAVPETPSSPRPALNLALGVVAGLVGGLGFALIFENLDTTLYEIEDIESVTRLPAIVKIPKANRKEINTFQGNFSPLSESFRSLAANLQVTNHHQSKKVLLMISAEPNQGKSMITCHLACALAELGKEVVIVDCDTRMPRLHRFFHIPNEIGLKDVLEQKVSLEDALQKSSFEGVDVLTSGSQFAHPSQMLGSAQMSKLIKCLSQKFDYVLLDSPAMLAVADVTALVPNAGGFILVVRRAHAKRDAVQAANKFLTEQNGKFLFLIVNQVESTNHYYYEHNKKPGSLADWVKGISKQIRGKRNQPS